MTMVVITAFFIKALWIIEKLDAKKNSKALLVHASIMFFNITADVACTIFVMVTASKLPHFFFNSIAFSYISWRLFDTIYIIFVLKIASQFTNYFIIR